MTCTFHHELLGWPALLGNCDQLQAHGCQFIGQIYGICCFAPSIIFQPQEFEAWKIKYPVICNISSREFGVEVDPIESHDPAAIH